MPRKRPDPPRKDPWLPSETFARQLSSLRKSENMTQEDFADRLQEAGLPLSRQTIARIEAEERDLSLDEAIQIALALDISPLDLMTREDNGKMSVGMRGFAGRESAVSPKELRDYFVGVSPLLGYVEDGRKFLARRDEREVDEPRGPSRVARLGFLLSNFSDAYERAAETRTASQVRRLRTLYEDARDELHELERAVRHLERDVQTTKARKES